MPPEEVDPLPDEPEEPEDPLPEPPRLELLVGADLAVTVNEARALMLVLGWTATM